MADLTNWAQENKAFLWKQLFTNIPLNLDDMDSLGFTGTVH